MYRLIKIRRWVSYWMTKRRVDCRVKCRVKFLSQILCDGKILFIQHASNQSLFNISSLGNLL